MGVRQLVLVLLLEISEVAHFKIELDFFNNTTAHHVVF